MTTRAVRDRMDRIEAALRPPATLRVLWHWEPTPPGWEGAPTIRLHWPEEAAGGDLSASSPLGVPKAR